jgi:hypothetical protein
MVAYLILAARLREELANLERMVSIASRSIAGTSQHPEDQDIYLNSAALALHSFYAGLEKIFISVAKELDQQVPTGGSWHLDLLNQMTYNLPSIRPPVITPHTKNLLQEYLSFRHVVRNVYTYSLDAERVVRLVDRLLDTFISVQTDLKQFLTFLDLAGQTSIDESN